MSRRLELRQVSKSFGDIDVLAGITLHVEPGEFVSILGPSGAGKSTIFRLLTGGLEGHGGGVDFDGQPLADARRPFAFMPQHDALMPWRTVIDNTALGLEVQGMSRKAARDEVAPLFGEFGLAGFEHKYPAQLSGGMRQRAALLRTVVQDRAMLLLDEPFGALDALTRTGMQRWLQTMWDRHRWTVLLITHDVREAVFLSDRIYVLSGRPARVLREVAIPLPRPRKDLASPEATAIEADILHTLLDPQPAQRT
ncbi:ABC transporter ATP-binding protein [Mesorhizobium mediterraneum]|uniref:ABC transporter ATP-binding protein n=1 Tax=Mesorhizobium mediterraneum TaxID=43617 RepID=A0AB36RE30_9HYPH|nr:ABC transporter ATP-binding protein [Mesorhizobium mediterraneum]PAQ02653.1 ABC transporter ATP-binding protein [Mesorhizobium mediterraneum]RWN40684.1 MAG: ABC transporter ATP-binding protein [Mesorhizobium sp.]TIT39620.1 MAG: ABC transporter ATP-binding protein [Mesorhizobium sp.]WIW55834.1 ABC transporter ATP-binding protein [Mesorhizobium mediterraneum]